MAVLKTTLVRDFGGAGVPPAVLRRDTITGIAGETLAAPQHALHKKARDDCLHPRFPPEGRRYKIHAPAA
jgi:hypothetical protein